MKLPSLMIICASAACGIVSPAVAQGVPDLVGTWTGASDGIRTDDGWRAGSVTFVISEQKGRSF